MDILEDKLIELLQGFGFPVFRQGSIADDEPYPPTFFTFWCNDEVENSAYDNETQSVYYDFDINVYSVDVQQVYSLLHEARKKLKENGFVIIRRGYDVGSDEASHTGRGMNVAYINTEK